MVNYCRENKKLNKSQQGWGGGVGCKMGMHESLPAPAWFLHTHSLLLFHWPVGGEKRKKRKVCQLGVNTVSCFPVMDTKTLICFMVKLLSFIIYMQYFLCRHTTLSCCIKTFMFITALSNFSLFLHYMHVYEYSVPSLNTYKEQKTFCFPILLKYELITNTNQTKIWYIEKQN